jgi:subfamily B ATP-binding cassette protein MsbA
MNDNLFRDAKGVEREDDALQQVYTTREIVERIWREHLYPRRRQLFMAMGAMIFASATTGVIPMVIKIAVDDIFVRRQMEIVYVLAFATFAVTAVKALSEYASKVIMAFLGNRFIADLRLAMFRRLAYADMKWLESTHSGLFLSGFLNDINYIRDTASRVIIALGENIAKVAFLGAAMIWLDPTLSAIILVSMPLAVMTMGRQRRKMHSSTKKTMQETGDMSRLVSQTLRGIRVVRAYGQEEREIKRAQNVIERTLEFTMRGSRARAISGPAIELLTGIGFSLAILYAGMEGARGRMTIGEFSAFMAAAMLLYQPLKALAQLQTSLQEGVAAAGRVFGIVDHETILKDRPGALALDLQKGTILFDEVSFAYEEGKPVLENFTLDIPAGKTIALVGPSGAGKSTILNLVMRFYDPVKGHVFIDDSDIAKVTIASLRENIALVTQDPVIFDDTIRANIAYGAPDAGIEDIKRAAKAAAADEFIAKMPKGYDSMAGEAGSSLSGGERQRIAIARAFLRDAPILLLDEPTSALDSQAEEKVQKALSTLMKGRTVLMIAHRLSTVKNADLICVLDRGRIIEKGTHDELLGENGLYSELYATQFRQESVD